jgi:tetratricopeptide (TPR) repeat protein
VVFFATHPSTQERIETLEKLADQAAAAAPAGSGQRERYAAAVGGFRPAWIQEEIRKGEYQAELVMLDQLAAGGILPAETEYYKAEIYRIRNADGDSALAAAAYERAIGTGKAPAAAHRSLGLIYRKAGDTARARSCFERYLQAAPDAGDAKMIKSYLEEMK